MSTQLGLLVVVITVLIMPEDTVAFFGKKTTAPSTDIRWGSTSTHCDENMITKNNKDKTYRSPSKDLPIIGIFVIRNDKTSWVWGEGKIRGTQTCKNICYKDARVYYSVLLGTAEAPQTIDIKFGTKSPEVCGFGYTVKVCYKVATSHG